jgi:hypothetical protein
MVKLPCQEVVWDLLPAIRAALAASLVRKGHSKQEAARLLGMAPAARHAEIPFARRVGFLGVHQAAVRRDLAVAGLPGDGAFVQPAKPGVLAQGNQLSLH